MDQTDASLNLQDLDPNIYSNMDVPIVDNYAQYGVDMPNYQSANNNYYAPSPPATFALQHDLLQVHGRVVQLETSVLSQILTRIVQLKRNVLEVTREAVAAKERADTIEHTLNELVAANEEATKAGDRAGKNTDPDVMKVRRAVISQIHEVTDRLVGLNTRDETTGKLNKTLRDPLLPGEVDDVFERPNWQLNLADHANAVFVDKVLNIVHGAVMEDQVLKEPKLGNTSKADVAAMAKVYFNTLRTNWKTQNDAGARLKREQKNVEQKRTARVEDKCDDLRACLEDLEAEYGAAATVGAAEIVLAEYMSSEHSDSGKARKENWDTHRGKKGGGTNGLEVRDKAWRSAQTKLLYARLKTFRNARRNRTRDATTGKKLSFAGKARMPRFPGMKVNVNNKPPPVKRDRLPYASMVDPAWKAKMELEGVHIPVLADPPSFTIFSLNISMEDLDLEERAYFADDDMA
ncbi:hypothetical protein C8R46DRAFT_1115795 [Mycena filopes]|nr:hypothetical protein C8R46DRAFT_1115795 [Mycena filopes]